MLPHESSPKTWKVVPGCWSIRLLAAKMFGTDFRALQISARGDRDRRNISGNYCCAEQPQSGDDIVMTSFR